MISQKIGYSFSETISGFGMIEYTDTQNYPKVTFSVTADHAVVKQKVINYLSNPRMFYMPEDGGAFDRFNKPVAPNIRIDFFQKALAEMNAAIGIAALRQ